MKLTLVFFITFLVLEGYGQKSKPLVEQSSNSSRHKNLPDSALLDLVQKQTFRYFWDFGHPVSGMARERSNKTSQYGDEVVAVGGTGFGIMSLIVATQRKWITRDQAVERMIRIVDFLLNATCYHGMFPHWMNGATGKTIPLNRRDDGADIVESSYLFMGLLCAREYFNKESPAESHIRQRITWMWNEADWAWFTRDNLSVLFWHWSPNNGWAMNNEIRGWNECLITYVMAASSPQHTIGKEVYEKGWANSSRFRNDRDYYGIRLPLGEDYGGPLFFAHYSFMGLDPHQLKDHYADYWLQNLNHVLINYKHCVLNPKKYKGYGENCWGLTASDNRTGYGAHSPTNDLGVISPTAALSSFPYTPEYSMKALRHFYDDLGDRIWSDYGFVDAFNESEGWFGTSHLAIDQGPIIVMIENYRSGLLWKLFMQIQEIQTGLRKLGFETPYLK